MNRPVNICTSTLPAFTLDQALNLAASAGYEGVELRVHGNCHVSLQELQRRCDEIRRRVEAYRLDLQVYSTCFGVNEPGAIEAMTDICLRTGVKYFRATLPLAGVAAVRNLGYERATVPSYRESVAAPELLRNLRATLQNLSRRAKLAGVCILLEIHWGTVMSSFTSAHALVRDLDPETIAITFDPANMVIEGKEDWEYGIELLRAHLANVHIKNASWVRQAGNWTWQWDGLQQGMVEWPQLFRLLALRGYRGMLAMEDFLVPRSYEAALEHLTALRREATLLLDQGDARRAA
ncbi:MAG TPA: sugar phosphate isomerase/epimerase [Steroidobacteraceae bacterium]|nr:sugar phosphate isomerase/epimerase [Steroidobacteraceae bacterium]